MVRHLHILQVEDEEFDIEAVDRLLQNLTFPYTHSVATSGPMALDMLRGENNYKPLPRPYLILLDLGLPGMSGLELLAELRQDPQLRRSLVLVLGDSFNDRDRDIAYDYNISGYISKQQLVQTGTLLPTLLECLYHLVEFPD